MAAIGDQVVDAQRQIALEQAAALKVQNTTLKAEQLSAAPVEQAPLPPANSTEEAVAALRASQLEQIASTDPAQQIIAADNANRPSAVTPVLEPPTREQTRLDFEAENAPIEPIDTDTSILDAQTPVDVVSSIASGTVGVGQTIIDSLVGGTAEFVATLGSGKSEEILAKQRNGLALTEDEEIYSRQFDHLTASRTIEQVQAGRQIVVDAFQKGRDLVETDRVTQAKADLTQGLSEAFDDERFIASLPEVLAENPLGALTMITESIPFMFTAASKATRVPFAIAFTGENYKAGLEVYEQEFGDTPDGGEKALILLGSAFIAAMNSAGARYVTGEAVAKNMTSRLSKTSLVQYLNTASTKLGTKLTPAESNRVATLLLKAGQTAAVPAFNLSKKAAVEAVQEGSEPLIIDATARQSLDFEHETRREAAIGSVIGGLSGAGIGGSVDLAQYTGKSLAERQERVQRERAAIEAGNNPTETVKNASINTIDPEFRTEWEGVSLGVGPNYDPLTAAQAGPADVNDIDSIRGTIGHIKNAIRVYTQFDPEEIETTQAIADYSESVIEQHALLTAYETRIQELGQAEIERINDQGSNTAENDKQSADVLRDVYFGSDQPPISTNNVEDLRKQFEQYKSQFSAEEIAAFQQTLASAEKVKAAEVAISEVVVGTQRKSADEVHDEVINGSKAPDGSRRNKGGSTYRTLLQGAILGENKVAFDKEMTQLRNFIKGQRSKLPDNHPARDGETAIKLNPEGKDLRNLLKNHWATIAKEIDYLTAIEQEALSNAEASATRPEPGRVDEASPTGEDTSVAQGRPLGAAAEVSPDTTAETARNGAAVATSPQGLPEDARSEAGRSGVAVEPDSPRAEADPGPREAIEDDGVTASDESARSPGVAESVTSLFEESEDPAPKSKSAISDESDTGNDEGNRARQPEDVSSEELVSSSEEGGSSSVVAPAVNPNLQGSIPIKSAPGQEAAIDIRPLKDTFQSAKDLERNIFLRAGSFKDFETFLATVKDMAPDLNIAFNSKPWKALRSVHKRAQSFVAVQKKHNLEVLGKELQVPYKKKTKDRPHVFGKDYAENLALGLAVETSPNVYEFRPEVIAAMSVATALWIKEESYRTLNVDAYTLSKWFGVDEKDISADVVNKFRDRGIPRNLVAQSIGGRIFQTLGIQPKGNAAVESKEKLQQSLGLIALELMEQRDEVIIIAHDKKTIDVDFWGQGAANLINTDKDAKNPQKDLLVNTVRVASAQEPTTEMDIVHPNFFDPFKNNAAGPYVDFPMLGETLFSIARNDKTALDEPKSTVNTTVRGGPTEVTAEQEVAMEASQNIQHQTNMNTAGLLAELGRPFMQKLLGFTDNPEQTTHVDNLDSVEGQNLEIDNQITRLLEHIDPEFGDFNSDDKPFYFGVFLSSSRRSFYDSNKFDPQNKTLHRFNVKLNNAPAVMPVDPSAKGFEKFLVAITTGLGITDEKQPLADHIAAFKEFTTDENLAVIDKAIRAKNGNAILSLLPDPGAHGFQALIELNQWAEARKASAESFETSMTMETDGVTNGAAIGFVQLAHTFSTDQMWKWFERIGVYRKSSGITGYQNWKSTGQNDSYQHMAQKFSDQMDREFDTDDKAAIQTILGPLANEDGVTKAARDLMKYPFMIHNYGSGTDKILEAIAVEIVDKWLKQVEVAVAANDIKALNELETLINSLYKGTVQINLEMSTALNQSIAQQRPGIEKSIVNTIEEPFKNALEDELGEFTDVRRQLNWAFQLQFKAFDIKYQEALEAIRTENKASGQPVVTVDQARKALGSVQYLLPGFQGAMTNTTPRNRIPVIKTETDFNTEDTNRLVQVYLDKVNKRDFSSTKGQAVEKIFVDGGISGVVLTIHSLDATIQQRTQERLRKEHGAEIISIFDAGLTDPLSSPIYAEMYNQVFLETMRDYSLLKDVRAMMSGIETSDVADHADLQQQIKGLATVGSGKAKKPRFNTIDEFMKELDNQITLNEEVKAEVFGQELVIEQMIHSAEASMYQYDPATAQASPIVFETRKGENNAPRSDQNRTVPAKAADKDTEAKAVQPKGESVPEPVKDIPIDQPLKDIESSLAQRMAKLPKVVQKLVAGIAGADMSPAGTFNRKTKEIWVNNRVIADSLAKLTKNPWLAGFTRPQLVTHIVYHEVGHAIDMEFGLSTKLSEEDPGLAEVRKVWKDAKQGTDLYKYLSLVFSSSQYGQAPALQPAEFIAQMFAWYYSNPATMQAEFPDMFAGMNQLNDTFLQQTNEVPTSPADKRTVSTRQPSPEEQNSKAGQKAAAEADPAPEEPGESDIAKGTKLSVNSNRGPQEIEVRQAFTMFGRDLVVHRPIGDSESKSWVVSEATTGLNTGRRYSTQKEAIADTVTVLNEIGGLKFNDAVARGQTANEEGVSRRSPYPDKQSSARQIDIDNFVADSQQDVTSQNVQTVFDSLGGLTAPSKISTDFRAYLQSVLETIVKKGIEPLDKLILQIKSDQSGDFGAISGHNIYMNINSTRETYSEQSAEEVLVHELLHAVSQQYIDTNPAGRRKLRRLYELARKNVTYEDFLKYDSQGNLLFTISREAEIAQAKKTYDYVFNQRDSRTRRGAPTNSALHEFFTYALSNEQMVKKLSTIPTRDTKYTKEGTLFEAFQSYLEDVFNWIAQTLNDISAPNVRQEVENLAHSIIAAEQNGIFTTLNAIEHGFAAGRKPIDLSVSYLVTQTAKMVRAVIPAAGRERLLGFIPNTLRAVSNTVLYHQNMEGVPEDNPTSAAVKDATGAMINMFTSEEGVLRKTMNSVINKSAEFQGWHKMLRNSKHMVDQLRSTVSSTIAINVRDRFSQELTKDENKAVTRAFLQADIDSLDRYSLNQLAELMRDKAKLAREINAKRKDLFKQMAPNDRKYFAAQATGLAKLMIHGYTNTYNQNLNVHQILNATGQVELAANLDEYISLLALQELPDSGRNMAATVIEREQAAQAEDNGVTYLRAQHRAFKQESLKRLFDNNPMLMTKGHMAEVYDQAVSVQIAGLDEEQRMKSEGYVLVSTVNDDSTVLNPVQKGVYVANNNPHVQRLKSIVSVADKSVKGTTLADSDRAAGRGYSRVLDALQINKTKNQYTKRAAGSHTSDGHRLVPVKNESGDIVNYRYVMVEEMREKYLKKDYDIGTVLGAMHASIESKANSELINNEAVRAAHGDFIENGAEQPDKFIAITNDPKSAHFETYKLMPTAMRLEVDRVFGKGQPMMVRAELVDLIFGFRKATLANLPGIKDQPWEHVVRLIENGWQEIIAQEKVNIVIKTIDVMLNNIISNTILLKVMGIPMSDILRDTKEAIDGMNQYQADFEELLALQKELAGDATKANDAKFISRVEFLRNELKSNPVDDLVQEGVFQSITEDIDADQYGDKTKMIDWLQNTVGKHTPEFVKKGIELAYISENTQAFKFLMKTTQYSDFTARYVMWKHEMAKPDANKDAVVNDIIRTFINYDDPSNKYTQWGNDMGIVMFTKFAIGIQNVIVRIAGKKTANLVTSILAQRMLGEQSDITDSFLLTGGVTHMFHLDPVEHVQNAFAPFGIVTASDYLF